MREDLKELTELANTVSGDEEIENLIQQISRIMDSEEPESALLHLRAGLFVKLQQHHKAINDYNLILSKNKSDQKALVQLEMLSTILRYNNTDIYSSTNTNMDPWME
jgi:hypothetical protein